MRTGTAQKKEVSYEGFDLLDGRHPLREAAPGIQVDYRVRLRPGGKVFYFNFDLAREMGLIPSTHPNQLTPELEKKIVETFGIVIINEYDLQKQTRFPSHTIKPHLYMATRYLQLQHPNKKGTTSGDGRGIWNGTISHRGKTWDVTSSGTGATCLSPAVAAEKRFFKTGDPKVCYGNGYNCVPDGLSAALLSEVFYQNGIPTERTLAIVSFEGGSSVNVRAGHNLLRPSHFFAPLKQGNLEMLKQLVDYVIDRQVGNGTWERFPKGKARFWKFAEKMTDVFSQMAARFESDYIFCWLDWDGDNILVDGGIIDYGSIRQFGMFHDEYRYDDSDRFSTKMTEQKSKARYIVQSFIQMADFLCTGRKRKISKFIGHPLLRRFEERFEESMDEFLLKRVGFSREDTQEVLRHHRRWVRHFREHFAYFERMQSSKGIYPVNDGITSDAVFCMRDLLREFPKHILRSEKGRMEFEDFIEIARSSYARPSDLRNTSKKRRHFDGFQSAYLGLVRVVAQARKQDERQIVREVLMRSSVVNRIDRITGDAVLGVTQKLMQASKAKSQAEIQELIERFIRTQIFDPAHRSKIALPKAPALRSIFVDLLHEVRDAREGL